MHVIVVYNIPFAFVQYERYVINTQALLEVIVNILDTLENIQI